jgi:excinuclease ABC subunit B
MSTPPGEGKSLPNIHDNARGESIPFKVEAPYEPSGDQGQAIEKLADGVLKGYGRQTLKGVTAAAKTYTMAKIIEKVQRPTLVLSHNKTLAAQLYREFKSFFPHNAVEYFVSTLRLLSAGGLCSGQGSLYREGCRYQRRDRSAPPFSIVFVDGAAGCIVVATVSCIFGLGNPVSLKDMVHTFRVGSVSIIMMIWNNWSGCSSNATTWFSSAVVFRVRGDVIEICPSYLEKRGQDQYRLGRDRLDPVVRPADRRETGTGGFVHALSCQAVCHAPEEVRAAIGRIRSEMEDQYAYFVNSGRPLEAERIKTRTEYDLEMLQEIGHCSGIENYSRQLSNRKPGERPAVLLDYFPPGFLTFIDESHVTLPQVGLCTRDIDPGRVIGETMGFRLPSALDTDR